jgi:hypothetical protein
MRGTEQEIIDSVDYDPDSDTYRAEFIPSAVEPSAAIVAALASVRRCETSDLKPLYNDIDTDSLNTLIGSATDETTVTFEVDEFSITIRASGVVEIVPPEADGQP